MLETNEVGRTRFASFHFVPSVDEETYERSQFEARHRAFCLSLRRVVKVTRILEGHHLHEVEAVVGNHIGLESACYELVAISPLVQKKIDELERVVKDLEAMR